MKNQVMYKVSHSPKKRGKGACSTSTLPTGRKDFVRITSTIPILKLRTAISPQTTRQKASDAHPPRPQPCGTDPSPPSWNGTSKDNPGTLSPSLIRPLNHDMRLADSVP